MALDLNSGQRMKREKLITVAEWTVGSGQSATQKRQILGVRTPDSSIELNIDKQKTTDVCGHTYTDIEKVEPSQTFDPHYILGGSDFDEYLMNAFLDCDTDKFNQVFNVYVINAADDSGSGSSHAYATRKYSNCTIAPTSLGGENYVGMPIEVDYDSSPTKGTVDKLSDDFIFSAAS